MIWINTKSLGEGYRAYCYFYIEIWVDTCGQWRMRIEEHHKAIILKAKTGEEAKAEAERHIRLSLEEELEKIQMALEQFGD